MKNTISKRKQEDIIKEWAFFDKVYVSILCTTFNQKKYVHETLSSFISQKTRYKFEVIVHDDCSTDGTTDIIREFKDMYPEIIKPIFQSQNQYSKGHNKPFVNALNTSQGVFIAICEGDDYWSDEEKIEKQVMALNRFEGVGLCFHPAQVLDNNVLSKI